MVADSYIGERAMREALVLPVKTERLVIPDDTTPTGTETVEVQVVADDEMDAALIDALGGDVPPATQPGLTMLWSADTPARPFAMLVWPLSASRRATDGRRWHIAPYIVLMIAAPLPAVFAPRYLHIPLVVVLMLVSWTAVAVIFRRYLELRESVSA